jgi:hypothetical protein
MRKRCVLSVLLVTLAVAATAAAQTAVITSGDVSPWWDESLSGLELIGPGTHLIGEFYNGPVQYGFEPGTRGDLNGRVTLNPYSSNHTFTEQVNGTTYSSVWIKADITFSTQPFLVPRAPEGTRTTFSTPFTMTGTFSGYSDKDATNQVFSVSLQGSGVAWSLTMRMMSDSWFLEQGGAQSYGFTGPLPTPWTATDVGAVGTTGISSYDKGRFFVAGAGADIWGTADAFQFVSQALHGDGSIVVRVEGEQMPSSFAKAGVMIRQTTDPGSASVILDVKPDGGVEFMTRSASGGATRFIGGATTTSPPWLQLVRTGSTVTASVSTDGSTWTGLGTATLSGSALIGLAVTSHDSTTLNQAMFDQLGVSASATGDGGTLPVSWSHGDIGAVGVAGNATQSGGTFMVRGAGGDIWGPVDAFHYAYTPMDSDGEIDARVVSMDNTSPFAKAGVMFRGSLDPGSTHVILDVKPDGGVEFMTRSADGGSTSFIAGAQKSFPVSLKLQRSAGAPASTVIAYVMDNSTGTWQQIGSVQVALGTATTTGLAVTSHNSSMLNTGVFDTVHVTKNLLVEGGFEGYAPPALGPPGWVSDNPFRKIPATSETHHPRSGSNNGVCAQTTFENCGIYQEVTAPADGDYVLTMFAYSDRSGGLVGVAVNGTTVQSADVAVQANYGETPYTMHFRAAAGATIRVWMYSPSSPGFVAIDDVALMQDNEAP